MKYSNNKLITLSEEVEKVTHRFSDCSVGYRAKPIMDGSFPSFHTLKYFAMPDTLRALVKETVTDINLNIETYFLMFKEGDGLGMTKYTDRCFFINKAYLLSGAATVTIGTNQTDMVAGDYIELPLNKHHSVEPKSPCMFFIEMQIDKNFNNKGN